MPATAGGRMTDLTTQPRQAHCQTPCPPSSRRAVEYACNLCPAASAAAVIGEAIPPDRVPVALHHHLTACDAVGAGSLRVVNVAGVYVRQSGSQGNAAGTTQGARWCRRQASKLVVRVEGAEVKRDVAVKIGGDPRRQRVQLLIGVIETRDQQRRHLQPDRGLLMDIAQGVLDRVEMTSANMTVEVLAEGFEIDVGGVDVGVELAAWLAADIARADRHCVDASLMADVRHVDRVLVEDHRIVVRERDASAPEPLRRLDNLGW